MQPHFRLGLIINPFAGIGGAVAMKGSDSAEIRELALSLGADLKAEQRVSQALSILLPYRDNIEIVTVAGAMGENLCQRLGFTYRVVYHPKAEQTEAIDTELAATEMLEYPLDLLLFAGGDGTARNVCRIIGERLPVLGIPAGCKIHSGVYGVTPKASGAIVEKMLNGELVSLMDANVMDIDEGLFREGIVKARAYGEMRIPSDLNYVQAVKSGGRESDELVLADLADFVIQEMDEQQFVMGSGSTVDYIMQQLGLENSLLGVDVVHRNQLLAADVTAAQLLPLVSARPTKLVITLIGGQGHILGRGNQQLSPSVIRQIGRENILIVATKRKLQQLNGRPLIVDSGDLALDAMLAGSMPVLTGFNDFVLYRVDAPAVGK